MFLPKNTMFPSNSIKKREKHTPMDMSTYARENGCLFVNTVDS